MNLVCKFHHLWALPHYVTRRLLSCNNIELSKRRLSYSQDDSPSVCIVGSGPAGFYTAQQLLKSHPSLKVDMYEQLPVPFGLVRFGVAPDHPEVKNVIHTFTNTAKNERFTFLGNVCIGRDITVEELRKAYCAVVFSYGAEDDRLLNIPGENLKGVLSARSFVSWYNGLPDLRHLKPDLNCDTAVVLGHGNVAIDVARILLTPIDILKKTDITCYALDVLSTSKVKRVYTVGRRGPVQAAFTIKEFREITKLPGCKTVVNEHDLHHISDNLKELSRPRRRLTELIIKTAQQKALDPTSSVKEWHVKFKRSPLEVLSDDGHHVNAIRLGVNELEGPFGENQQPRLTDEVEEISCGLVLRSIGYQGLCTMDDLPFDDKNGIISNQEGRVIGELGLYCSGWIRRGPTGVIVNTMACGFDTGKIIVQDLNNGLITHSREQLGKELTMKTLRTKGIQVVNFEGWEKINLEEIRRGKVLGKTREKIVDVNEMLQIARC